jgi:AcrR family transcriptional regulator
MKSPDVDSSKPDERRRRARGASPTNARGANPANAHGSRPRGRRPGPNSTRQTILTAAQRQFAKLGYDRTSFRSIASAAGVDQKLVAYFFGTKQQLFLAAVSPGVPSNVGETLADLVSGSRRTLGTRIARMMVTRLEDPKSRDQLVGAVRAAASEPDAAQMMREMRVRLIAEFGPAVAEVIGEEDMELRIAMVNAQFLGLVMARHVIGAEPLVSLDADQLVALLGPILQRLLTGPIASR